MYLNHPYRNPVKASSIPFRPTGVWRAEVVAVNDDATVNIVVPRIAGPHNVFERVEVIGFANTPMYAIGDAVFVSFFEGIPDDLVVIGPVRRPSTPGVTPGGGGGGGGTSEPAREGVDALLFSWPGETISLNPTGLAPMPRPALTSDIRFTLQTAGSSATIIAVKVNGTTVSTATIPSGATSVTHSWIASLEDTDAVSMQVTSAGTGAADLVAEVRYAGMGSADGLVISWPGGLLATRESGDFPLPRPATTSSIRFTLLEAGTTATVIAVRVNGTTAETVSIPANATAYTYPWVVELDANDAISMQITTVGTGASNLVAQVRYS